MQPLGKTVRSFLKKLKIQLPMTQYLPREIQNSNYERPTHPHGHCSVIYSSQDMEATRVPIDRRPDKEEVVPVLSGMLPSHGKHKILASGTTRMDPEGPVLGEVSHRGRQTPCELTYTWTLTDKQTDSDSENELASGGGGGWRGQGSYEEQCR